MKDPISVVMAYLGGFSMISQTRSLIKESVFKNSMYLVFGTALTSMLGLAFTIVVTRYFSPSEVGFYSATVSVAGLLAIVSRFGLDNTLTRFVPHDKNPNLLIGSCMTLSALFAGILAVIYLIGIDIWSPALDELARTLPYIILFIAMTVLTTALTMQQSLFVVKGHAKYLLVSNGTRDTTKIAVALAAMSLGIYGMLMGFTLGMAVGILLAAAILHWKDHSYHPTIGVDKTVIKRLVPYSSANYVAAMFGTAPIIILPAIVVNLLGPEEGGYFFVSWSVAQMIFTIISAVGTSFFAEGSKRPDEVWEVAKKAFRIVMLILVPVVIITLLFADEALRIFGHSYSQNSTELLWILTIAAIPLGYDAVFRAVKKVTMEKGMLIFYSMVSGIGLIVFGVIFMQLIGLVGVGVGFLFSEIIVVTLMWKEASLLRLFKRVRGSGSP